MARTIKPQTTSVGLELITDAPLRVLRGARFVTLLDEAGNNILVAIRLEQRPMVQRMQAPTKPRRVKESAECASTPTELTAKELPTKSASPKSPRATKANGATAKKAPAKKART